MRGQSEVIAFLLLFIIGVVLFSSATLWSRGIFDENVDYTRIESAENFVNNLDSEISDVIKFGGLREVDFTVDGSIEINTPSSIEVKTPLSVSIQENWVNISEKTGSYIEERKDGEYMVLRLTYPQTDYKVYFFTDGSSISQPSYVKLEKNSTIFGEPPVIKIKVTFV